MRQESSPTQAHPMQTPFQERPRPIVGGDRHMKMLIAVDGSEFAEWSVQMLEAIAGRPPDRVTLLHVVDSASLKSSARKHAALSKQAIAAMTKAGDQMLRR
ncbi:MAG: hypothetical protein GDA68_18845, partial [Nitrospira sp. CR2.1]|nr:hypothetical protein [Nitrospira sp. CR2.1]